MDSALSEEERKIALQYGNLFLSLKARSAGYRKAPEEAVRKISHYSSDMDILLVGEGDFSFAAALARAFQTAPRLLATSLDSQEMLHTNYGRRSMKRRLAELSRRNAVVITEVDVNRIVDHPSLHHLAFDRIIYNFPHSGFVSGLNEYDTALIRKHRQLIQSFFKNVRRILKEGGEVHVTHHMCQPYSEWRLEEEAAKSGFELRACHKFKTKAFCGYKPRRGAGANAGGTFFLRKPVTFIFFIPQSSPSSCHKIPCPPPQSSLCSIPSDPPSHLPSMPHSCPSVLCPPRLHPPSPSPSPCPTHVPHFFNAVSTPMSLHHVSPSPPTITSPKPLMKVSLAPPFSPSPITSNGVSTPMSLHHVSPSPPTITSPKTLMKVSLAPPFSHSPITYNAVSIPMSLHHVSPSPPTITSPKPLMKVSLAPPFSPSPITHHNSHKSSNSHVNPYNPPTPFTPASQHECSPPSSSKEKSSHQECSPRSSSKEKAKPISCISVVVRIIFILVALMIIGSFHVDDTCDTARLKSCYNSKATSKT